MTILIDFSQIPIKKVGVGVYAVETFKRLINFYQDDKFVVIVQNDDMEIILMLQPYLNVEIIKINAKIFRKFAMRLLFEQLYIPYLSRKHHAHIIHSLHYSFPLIKTKAKKVITIHDLTFFIYPQLHTVIKRFYFRFFIRLASTSKQNLICVSESTAKDLKRLIPSYNSDIKVIPLASSLNINNNPLLKDSIVNSLPSKYILFIGTLEPRKNIDGLLKAYNHIKSKINLKLVIVGKKGWYYDSIFDYIKSNSLEEDIFFTGFVTEEEKSQILQRAFIFIYPSFYEGFGLPVLEALSMGIPTITSNISSMPEVGGNAVLLVNPTDTKDIASKLIELVDNEDIRKRLISEGKIQASKYSWDNTTKQTYNLYKSIVINNL